MDYTTLGRAGLEVSVAGLGAGGGSRLGRKTGKSFGDSVRLVHAAVDLGVNFIDTRPPLPDADRRRLVELFGALEGVGLEHGMAKT